MLGTTTSPLGVTIGTWSRTNSFELERTTRPSTLHATDEELVTARSYLKRKRNRVIIYYITSTSKVLRNCERMVLEYEKTL